MSNVLVITTSLRAKSNYDAGEAAKKTAEQQEAYDFGKSLK